MTSISKKTLLKSLSIAIYSSIALLAALPVIAQTATRTPAIQPRITAPIDNSSRATLIGSHPQRASPANDVGAVSPSMKLQGISLVFSRSAAQQTALNTLLAAQQNPSSPLFHHWLTPTQYAAQFGVADADIAAVETWLEQQGFSVDSVSRSRNRIFFSGTAAQVASAFGAPLHYYKTPATANEPAVTHFAPSTDLTIPSALASSVLSIDNLSSFRPHSHLKLRSSQAQPRYTVQGNQAYFLAPPDVETIYDIKPAYSEGYNGSGQTIAVVGQSAIVTSDITNFQTILGLTAKAPTTTLLQGTGTSVVSKGDESESDIDLEYSSALAPGATINFYYTGSNTNYGVFNALEYVIDGDLAPIISISYGDCEFDLGAAEIASLDSSLAQAALQGESVIASAGDDGSSDCAENTDLKSATEEEALAVDYPASSPYTTGMGGTEFSTADTTPVNTTYWTSDPNASTDLISSAISYIPEQVWNDDATAVADGVTAGESPISAGGGGASLYETRPTWQTGVTGIPTGTTRLVPDISLDASNFNAPYLYCTSDTSSWDTGQTGSCVDGAFSDPVGNELYYTLAGGTSFDAPIFAGLLAVINQAKGYTATGQGVVNPTLYTLAANATTYASAFHDITSGGNECDAGTTYCGTGAQTTEFQSTVGYDEASGLGSIDFYHLLTAWPTNTTGVGTATYSSTTTLTAATLTPASGASDTITITVASASSASTTVPTGSVSVSVNGTVVNADLQLVNGVATYDFSSTTAGSQTITATYSGDSIYSSSTGSLTLDVGGSTSTSGTFALTAANASVAAGSSTSGTITITPANGYTGTVDLAINSSSFPGCVSLSSTSVAVSGSSGGTATYSILASEAPCPTTSAFRPGSQKAISHISTSHKPKSPWKQLPIPATFAGTFLLVCFRRSRPLRSKLLRAGVALGLVLVLSFSGLALTGCGGSSTSTKTTTTPAGTYTITVTGTDSKTSTITSSTTFTVTVTAS